MRWKLLTALLLMATEAHAGDSLRGTYGLDRTPVQQDWSSFNVGLHVGTAHSDGKTSRTHGEGGLIELDIRNGLFPASTASDGSAANLSLSAGYDRQFGSFILGGEVDVNLTDINSAFSMNRIDPNPTAPFTGVQTITGYETSLDFVSTARMRLGYDLGRTMIYATAGVAAGEVYNSFKLRIPELGYTSSGWDSESYKYGYVVGAGLEHRVSERLRLRAEYQYMDLGDSTIQATDPAAFPGQRLDYTFKNAFSTAKIGVVYGF